jgi:hypothetical protein
MKLKMEKKDNYYLLSQINYLLSQYKITIVKKIKFPWIEDNYISENRTLFNLSTFKSAFGSLLYITKILQKRPNWSFHFQ